MRTGSGTGASGLKWLLSDHLGSTSIMAEGSSGAKTSELRYKPWGELRFASGVTPTARRYTGQSAEGLGLYFYKARWYDAYLNRWTSPDTIIPDPYNPIDHDRYAYSRNNPVKYTDPSGHVAVEGTGGGGLDELTLKEIWRREAVEIADRYFDKRREGTTVSWQGLPWRDKYILEKGGYNEDIYEDHIQPAVTNAEPIYDPAIWVISAVSLIKLGPSTVAAIGEYFCFDGDCGNEFDVTTHALERMELRGISIDQLNQALQVKPFSYYHEGVWKLGYYNPITRIFVAVNNDTVLTVIANVKPQYIENLQRANP